MFQFNPGRITQGLPVVQPELLFGENHITESLFKLTFNISPQAFFQVMFSLIIIIVKCLRDNVL